MPKKEMRDLSIITYSVIAFICIHLLVLGFSSFYFFQYANRAHNVKLVSGVANVVRALVFADQFHHVDKSIMALKKQSALPELVIYLQKEKHKKAVVLPYHPYLEINDVKRIIKSIESDDHVRLAIFLKNKKLWASIQSNANVAFTNPEIILRLITTIILPTIIILILIYLFFSRYKTLLVKVLSRKVSSSADEVKPSGNDPFKQMYGEIQVLKDRVKEVVDEKVLMLIALTHDINSPMLKLRLYTEKVKSDDVKELLVRELDYLKNVVDSSMAITKEQVLKKRKIDLSSLLALIKESRYQHDDAVKFKIPRKALIIQGAPELIKRAVINLVDNALKQADIVTVSAKHKNNHTLITIVDNGPGLPKDQLERLLKPFQQLEPSQQGSGLGLAIVNRIMSLHHGKLLISNVKPNGLKVELQFFDS